MANGREMERKAGDVSACFCRLRATLGSCTAPAHRHPPLPCPVNRPPHEFEWQVAEIYRCDAGPPLCTRQKQEESCSGSRLKGLPLDNKVPGKERPAEAMRPGLESHEHFRLRPSGTYCVLRHGGFFCCAGCKTLLHAGSVASDGMHLDDCLFQR